MTFLHSYEIATGAFVVASVLSGIAIFGAHHRIWRRIRRQPYASACEAAVERALRPRPFISFRAPRPVAKVSVH